MEEKRLSEKERLIQQIPFRLHVNDHKVLKKILIDDGMRFQTFVSACVEAYLRGDPSILKVVKDWKDLNTIPKDVRDKYTLSQRERRALLDELEEAGENDHAQGQSGDDRRVRGQREVGGRSEDR